MASAIDASEPADDVISAKADQRANWAAAKSEIETLQTAVAAATTTTTGVVELATDAETITGTDTERAVTPANVQAKVASATAKGIVELATDAETITGTDTGRAVTPANVQAKVTSATAKGIVELATDAETITGTDTERAVTPANVQAKLATVLVGENLVINGDMRIAQRGTSFATLTASQYTLDRMEWIDTGTTAGAVTITQDADVPTVAEAGTKFMNSLKIDVTTAEDLVSADAALYLSHKIEAQNCTQFGHGAASALDGRLSFWFKSTKTGIFTVNVDRDDASEKYSMEFTVGTTNTWEKHEDTVPGDIDGTAIADDNGIGLAIQFMMAVGGDGDTSTPDAWNASGATELATSNQVNLLDNAANNVFITGVQFEVGSVTTNFEHLSISVELDLADRYFQLYKMDAASHAFAAGVVRDTTTADFAFRFRRKMRNSPTLNITAADWTVFDGANQDVTGITVVSIDRGGMTVRPETGATMTAGNGCLLRSDATTNRSFDVDAEL